MVQAFQKNKELQETIVRILKFTSALLALRVAYLATKKIGLLTLANVFDIGKSMLLSAKRTIVFAQALARGRFAAMRMQFAIKGLARSYRNRIIFLLTSANYSSF